MQKLFFILIVCTPVLTAGAQEQPPLKVGYADTDYILSQMPDVQKMEEQVKTTQTRLQNEFAAKQQAFQSLYADYAEKIATLSDTARANREAKLQRMNAELQQFQQEANATLENTRKLHMAPIYLKVGKAITDVAAENGIAFIISRRIEGIEVVLYAHDSINVSNLVLQKLGITPVPDKK